MSIKADYLKKAIAWLLPYTCLLCGHRSDQPRDLCKACEKELPFITQENPSLAEGDQAIYGLFHYDQQIRKLILQLKFSHSLTNARILGELMAQQIINVWYTNQPLPEAIIPVPLHVTRLKTRGFNQAIELAKPISQAIKRPIDTDSIQRKKHTVAQATLNPTERKQNLTDAFCIKKHLPYDHIAILDDVLTTGATTRELCLAIRQKQAIKIDVWCVAKACFDLIT